MPTTMATDTNTVPDNLVLSYTRVSLETPLLYIFEEYILPSRP